MDHALNPFDPARRHDPDALVGRERELGLIDAMVARLAASAPAAPVVFCGRAGVGRTAVLEAVARRAAAHDWYAGLAAAELDEPLRDGVARAFARALTALAARRPGASGLRAAAEAVVAFSPHVLAELPVQVMASAGDVARGDLERDLRRLVGRVADSMRDLVGRGLLIVIDDLHRADPLDAAALLRTLSAAMRDGHPVGLVAAGTITLRHAVALGAPDTDSDTASGIDPVDVAPLPPADAAQLVVALARPTGVELETGAADAIAKATAGYPELLLLYAGAAWDSAPGPTITAADVAAGAAVARDRLARLVLTPAFAVSPAARRYVRAVAEADDPADSDLIARRLGDTTRFGSGASQMTELRDDLVRRGLLSTADGTHLAFVHPAARSFVLSWD
jgi:hypothetical protein